MGLTYRSGTAYYYQIKEDLVRRIASAEFRVDDRIPSELELAQQYGVSRPTIRQAILALVQDGVVTRSRGKGTFVLPPVIVSDAHAFTSFADEMRQQGIDHTAHLMSARQIVATDAIASDLRIAAGAAVYEITRSRLGDGTPLVVRTMQIARELAPDLLQKPIHEAPIYLILQREYNIVASGSHQHFSAVAAAEDIAAELQIPVGSPLLYWHGITVDSAQHPIARTSAYYRGDRFEFGIRQGNLRDERLPDVRIQDIPARDDEPASA
ncbi:MAG: GntR family transcriptional regulator [Vulcanimicrobiaceae bacterium]